MEENRLHRYLRIRLQPLAWLAMLAVALGQAGSLHWTLELFSHFVPHCALVLLLAALFYRRYWQGAAFLLVGLTLLYWSAAPFHSGGDARAGQPALRAVAYNLYLHNPDAAQDARWLESLDAQLIFVTEATPAWQPLLAPLRARGNGCGRYLDSPFGLALFSTVPLASCQVLDLDGAAAGFPYLRAELEDGRVIYGVHPPPPLGATLADARNASLRQLATRMASETGPVLVLGDFNSSPFSPQLRQFLDDAGLRRTSANGRPTWWPGLLSLDHALVRGKLPAQGAGAYPWRGSDHRAIWIDW